jgi:NADH-quinone oxidoreductase subunit F
VIGGGNAAVDAARTVLRLGAREVTLLYRRSRADMPALPEEIEAALAEGVAIQELASPVAIFGEDGIVRAIECQRMRPGPFDRTGRRQPVPDSEARFTLAADLVIAAIGQAPDSSPLLTDLGVKRRPDGTIEADADGRTSVPGVFAGGDAVTGPATVIEAIAAGRRAAIAIHRYLQGDRASLWKPARPAPAAFDPEAEPVPYGRCRAEELPTSERCRSFAEVEASLDAETAQREARRCLRCDFRDREH